MKLFFFLFLFRSEVEKVKNRKETDRYPNETPEDIGSAEIKIGYPKRHPSSKVWTRLGLHGLPGSSGNSDIWTKHYRAAMQSSRYRSLLSSSLILTCGWGSEPIRETWTGRGWPIERHKSCKVGCSRWYCKEKMDSPGWQGEELPACPGPTAQS